MKCILLAAGRGSRISRYLPNRPKCTIDIGGTSLIRYTINLLHKHGIEDIALCVGYRHEIIREELAGMGCKFYYNPFYDVTNSIASAWLSKEFIQGDDILIMNADVYLEEPLLIELLEKKITKDSHSILPVELYMDSSRIEQADYKFYCENGYLKKYGKELTPEETSGEYIGVAILSKDFLPQFVEQMNTMIETQQHSVWWENVIYALSEKTLIPVVDVNGKFWAEVDYVEDYERILAARNVTRKE